MLQVKLKLFKMTEKNGISGSIASVGTYLLSINQINAYMSLFLGLLSGISSIYTILYFYNLNKKKNEE
jgi:hypothetical protein